MEKKQYNPQLCPNCKTGRESYLLDHHSPFCPYLKYHDGKTCAFFEELAVTEADVVIEE